MTWLEVLTSEKEEIRHADFRSCLDGRSPAEWEQMARELEEFRANAGNLYQKVRATMFLSHLHQYYLMPVSEGNSLLPFAIVEHIRARRFEQAIGELLRLRREGADSPAILTAAGTAYRSLAFQTLAEQVRRSVRSFPGNRWMFRIGHTADYPLRLRPELLTPNPFPVLHEQTPVRLDLSHSAWSDIFFLAMDYPEGARVINLSVDLALRGGRGHGPKPPVEAYLRVIDEPVLRLVSVDLQARADLRTVEEVFDFAADYLGLLKAAVIASGLVPSGFEGTRQPLGDLLFRLTGSRGLGIEVVSQVNDIPKGSRLAVSTNLLASLIAVAMRATGQIANLTGPLEEADRRLVAARAILGEWLGGSGGGWQDSGGVWPGIKLIEAMEAAPGDPEHEVSRGRLLPRHTLLDETIPAAMRGKLEQSLVLVHGGMSQDVGPILEMCTERYLLRSRPEWEWRREAMSLFDELLGALREGDIERVARATQRNFDGPIQGIIPWAANAYTEALIEACRAEFGEDFWGFWMLGGMSGGGMGFVFNPRSRARAAEKMEEILASVKRRFAEAAPFAIEPVVYDFAINHRGTIAALRRQEDALLGRKYHLYTVPALLRVPAGKLPEERRSELARVAKKYQDLTESLFDSLFPTSTDTAQDAGELDRLLDSLGFDRAAHDRLRADYVANRIGLAQNILPASANIQNIRAGDLEQPRREYAGAGREAIREGKIAVVTLAGGVGSRWTHGAGTVKALLPFHRFGGRYYNFLEVHLAKTARAQERFGTRIPHIVTTSYLTGGPIERFCGQLDPLFAGLDCVVSPGRSIGLRLVPTLADLQYLWEVLPQQQLDAQKEKVRASARASLRRWVETMGEGSDYRANLPGQCIHPVGHWYEIPNLLRNGRLVALLERYPRLEYLLLHNVDTLGASLDEEFLGAHIEGGAAMSVEVVRKHYGDQGGSLARVDGRLRLVESLALPGEEFDYGLSHYNSGTYWFTIDGLLAAYGLRRSDLGQPEVVAEALRQAALRVPSYITIKEVKKRWGRGQEDVFPVAQFERLLGDMTALDEVKVRYLEAPRRRGQQLKEVAQLDPWLRDGSAGEIERMIF